MAVEDYTTYDSADPNSDLTITSTKIEFDTLVRAPRTYVVDDKGADHFGNFIHDVDCRASNTTDAMNVLVWGVSNLSEFTYQDCSDGDTAFGVVLGEDGVGTNITLKDFDGDVEDRYAAAVYTTYYLRITRSGTSLICDIYSNAERTSSLKQLSIVCSTETFKNIIALGGRDKGYGTQATTGWVANLDLQEAGVEHTHFSTDTMAIGDSLAALKVLLHSASDTHAIGDSLGAVATFNVALDDTLSMSDTLTSAVMAFNVALADTLDISDSLTPAATYNVAASDTMTISDSLLVGIAYVVALADRMTISDSLDAEKIYHVALADKMDISDSLLAAAEYNVTAADRLTISDSILAAATYNIALADTLGISDVLAVAATYAIALADTMNISDSAAAGWVLYVSLSDTMEMSDSLTVEEIEAVIRKIRRGQIYGLKPARVANVGRIGV